MKALQEHRDRESLELECEDRIKDAIPTIDFIDAEYPASGDSDRFSLRVPDFKQSYDYTKTSFAQIYTYYALLERIFKFEFSMTKINSSL